MYSEALLFVYGAGRLGARPPCNKASAFIVSHPAAVAKAAGSSGVANEQEPGISGRKPTPNHAGPLGVIMLWHSDWPKAPGLSPLAVWASVGLGFEDHLRT